MKWVFILALIVATPALAMVLRANRRLIVPACFLLGPALYLLGPTLWAAPSLALLAWCGARHLRQLHRRRGDRADRGDQRNAYPFNRQDRFRGLLFGPDYFGVWRRKSGCGRWLSILANRYRTTK